MISLWWSFTLTTIGVTGLVLVYRSQSLLGPSIGLAVQALWIAYAVATRQWWFLLSAFAYGGANVYGIIQRRSDRRRDGLTGVGIRNPDGPLMLRHLRAITSGSARRWPDTSTVTLSDDGRLWINRDES
ncbi:hypothetical protein [Nocardia wallacei]|uniref:hypothetical protein n=1 Tax=Nocardia wallacei TaxID=480035 RepID=UPI00245736EF|nr:hypothetical protein [Nocardia wallacei]